MGKAWAPGAAPPPSSPRGSVAFSPSRTALWLWGSLVVGLIPIPIGRTRGVSSRWLLGAPACPLRGQPSPLTHGGCRSDLGDLWRLWYVGTVTGSHSALENRPDPPHQGLECPGVQDTRSPHWGSATCPQPSETLIWGPRGGPEGAGRPPGPRLSLSRVGRASRYSAARPAARLCLDGPQDALLRPVRALLLLRGFWGHRRRLSECLQSPEGTQRGAVTPLPPDSWAEARAPGHAVPPARGTGHAAHCGVSFGV